MRFTRFAGCALAALISCLLSTDVLAAKFESRPYIFTSDVTVQGVLTASGGQVGPAATDALAGATATTMTIANTVSTGVSLGNSAVCDTILIGTNADADTITIGDSTDTTVSITDDQWAVSAAGLVTCPSIDAHSAGAFTIAPTTATSVSIGNSAACDTITIGTNADADTITIGDSTDTTVSITDDNWSISAAGVAKFPSVDASTAGAFTVGDSVATSVSIGNSAACDTITIGSNADDDTITIGDTQDTNVSITDNDWFISVAGVVAAPFVDSVLAGTLTIAGTTATVVSMGNSAACDAINVATNTDADVVTIGDWANDQIKIEGAVSRPKNGTTLTSSDTNLAKATLQAARFFLVDTSSNTVDVDFADDAALDAADVGSTWMFLKIGTGTNAMTVTAGASGVTTVTNHTIGAAATAEDIGDFIRCTAYTTTAIMCEISAAD